jgi:hypothetical protein
MEKVQKPKKINRVRLGGGGPYVDQKTFDSICQIRKEDGKSTGKVVDEAVAMLMRSRNS